MVPQASFTSKVFGASSNIVCVNTNTCYSGFFCIMKNNKRPRVAYVFFEFFRTKLRIFVCLKVGAWHAIKFIWVESPRYRVLKSISPWLSLSELKRTVGFLPSIVLYLRVRADRLFPNSRHCGSAKPAGAVAFEIMVTKHSRPFRKSSQRNIRLWQKTKEILYPDYRL